MTGDPPWGECIREDLVQMPHKFRKDQMLMVSTVLYEITQPGDFKMDMVTHFPEE